MAPPSSPKGNGDSSSLFASPWFFAAIGAALVGTQVALFFSMSGEPPAAGTPGAAPTLQTAPGTTGAPANPSDGTADTLDSSLNTKTTDRAIVPATAAEEPELEEWERKIDGAMDDSLTEAESIGTLLKIYPEMPEDGKYEVVEYLVDMVTDEDYGLLKPILLDPKTPPDVVEVILDDLYGRDEIVELPLMLEILKVPGHPASAEARETLVDYLETDFGDDIDQWSTKVNEYIQTNASDN